jgi:hydrogenase maturation factor
MSLLPTGKLPPADLARLLAALAPTDPRVLVGPGIGLDCAVLDLGEGRCLVAKADPVTFATEDIGWYAVQVNANDVATSGALPRWFLATVLLPAGRADLALAETILNDIARACRAIGAELVGGHTEVTHGLDHPVVSGAMLGEVARHDLILPSRAVPGDRLVLTKRLAIEATALLAREKAAELAARFDPEMLERARGFLARPGLSVLPDARAALAAGGVHAMHDPTEGGFATAVHELATAAGVGVEIQADAVPVYPETHLLCEHFGLDPWGVIASGSLLLAVTESETAAVVGRLRAAGIEASVVGHVLEAARSVCVRDASGVHPLRAFERDEVARLFV